MNNLNVTTTLAFAAWPLVAIWFYTTRPIGPATLWTILGGYLLLPIDASLKIPVIPAFDKDTVPTLAALFGCLAIAGRPVRLLNRFGLVELLFAIYLFSPLITSLLNNDPVVKGHTFIPGLGAYEGVSIILSQAFVLLPFVLGRQFLRSTVDVEQILRVLCIAGLAYSLLMLFELRMSPQLNKWVYGYYPQNLIVNIRSGSFRPIVFLANGLLTSLFVATAAIAAAALWRTRTVIARFPAGGVTVYLGMVLVLCKTLTSLMYGVVGVPLVRWMSPRIQLQVAMLMVALTLSYPILRVMNLIPTTSILVAANKISEERARSLDARFTNESQMLARESQRFWFGWGRFGRSHILNETGDDITLPDGRWIITMGQFGFIGFLAEFGLLCIPIFRAALSLRLVESKRERILFAALSVIVAVNVFNQLPNSSLSPWSWLLTGALLGRAEALRFASGSQKAQLRGTSALVGQPG